LPVSTPLKGRGAISNPAVRFEATRAEREADGWYQDEAPASIATTVLPEPARSVLTRNASPDIPFDRSINPYRGCEHGCIYCYARPSHAYLGLSPGLDFETKLFYKPDAVRLLGEEFRRRNYSAAPIMLGANTDPWQPVERRLGVTRAILELLEKWQHPVSIVTKSALIVRDIDIIARLAEKSLVQVMVSLTSLDPEIKRTLEPRAASASARLNVIRSLRAAGVPVGTLIAPIIPVITDHELESLLEAAAAAGVQRAGYVVLRLPLELRELFVEWLQAHHPGKAAHVMARIRDLRDGRSNDAAFGTRMTGTGTYAALLRQRFAVACRRLNIAPRDDLHLDCSRFADPDGGGRQIGLQF
jgi:DNA repair photolyase